MLSSCLAVCGVTVDHIFNEGYRLWKIQHVTGEADVFQAQSTLPIEKLQGTTMCNHIQFFRSALLSFLNVWGTFFPIS